MRETILAYKWSLVRAYISNVSLVCGVLGSKLVNLKFLAQIMEVSKLFVLVLAVSVLGKSSITVGRHLLILCIWIGMNVFGKTSKRNNCLSLSAKHNGKSAQIEQRELVWRSSGDCCGSLFQQWLKSQNWMVLSPQAHLF